MTGPILGPRYNLYLKYKYKEQNDGTEPGTSVRLIFVTWRVEKDQVSFTNSVNW